MEGKSYLKIKLGIFEKKKKENKYKNVSKRTKSKKD